MINITLPAIVVEKVSNGFVIEWQQLVPDGERKGSERTRRVSAIATDDVGLLKLVAKAADDVSKLPT